jgi:hypothetical protein
VIRSRFMRPPGECGEERIARCSERGHASTSMNVS